MSGVDIEFGADADAAGIVLLIVHCALFLAAIGVSVAPAARGSPGVLGAPASRERSRSLADVVIPLVLIATNPAYASVLLDRP